MSEQVTADSKVLLHFTLRLSDGTVAESSYQAGKPALFCLGNSTLSPQLEQQLLGLTVGDKRNFTLTPEQAFGVRNPDLVQYFSRRDFVRTGVPEPGTIMMFNHNNGGELAGLIRDVACDAVTVDFNHPLAGEVVTFDIEVLKIDSSTDEVTYAHTSG
ncbi:MAG: FKBP-type peptidyl-prolyl cis-trans isomerase [Enterobacteriaceae bacterium]